MKLLAVFLASLAVVHCHDKEYHLLKKWAVMKACESCIGKEASKQYLVEVKTAIATCRRQDAPELELPMFQSTFRTASALMSNAYKKDMPTDFDEMMKKYMFEKMFKSMMEDEEYSMGNQHKRRFRFRRDTEEKENQIALGDRLNEKLQEQKVELQNEIGNYTCMLKQCGVLNEQNQFADVQSLVDRFNRYPIQNKWVKDHIEHDVRICHAVASSLPQEYLNECIMGPEFQKVKAYKKCLKYRKMRTCMNNDIREQLEINFAPLETLIKQTDLKEHELLPLVQKILHGDMEDDM